LSHYAFVLRKFGTLQRPSEVHRTLEEAREILLLLVKSAPDALPSSQDIPPPPVANSLDDSSTPTPPTASPPPEPSAPAIATATCPPPEPHPSPSGFEKFDRFDNSDAAELCLAALDCAAFSDLMDTPSAWRGYLQRVHADVQALRPRFASSQQFAREAAKWASRLLEKAREFRGSRCAILVEKAGETVRFASELGGVGIFEDAATCLRDAVELLREVSRLFVVLEVEDRLIYAHRIERELAPKLRLWDSQREALRSCDPLALANNADLSFMALRFPSLLDADEATPSPQDPAADIDPLSLKLTDVGLLSTSLLIALHAQPLVSLSLRDAPLVSGRALALVVAHHGSSLASLRFEGMHNLNFKEFIPGLAYATNLTSLNLIDTSVADHDLAAMLPHLSELAELGVAQSDALSDTSVALVGEACRELTSIDVSFCALVSDFALQRISRGCRLLRRLRAVGAPSPSPLSAEQNIHTYIFCIYYVFMT
jgi:hypothetical protein